MERNYHLTNDLLFTWEENWLCALLCSQLLGAKENLAVTNPGYGALRQFPQLFMGDETCLCQLPTNFLWHLFLEMSNCKNEDCRDVFQMAPSLFLSLVFIIKVL